MIPVWTTGSFMYLLLCDIRGIPLESFKKYQDPDITSSPTPQDGLHHRTHDNAADSREY